MVKKLLLLLVLGVLGFLGGKAFAQGGVTGGPISTPNTIPNLSTPANPSSGFVKIYAKGGALCALSSTGVETCTGGSGGGGTPAGVTGDFQYNSGGAFAAANLTQDGNGAVNASTTFNWATKSTPTFNSGGTTTCDWALSNVCLVNMTGNTTLAMTHPVGSGPYLIRSCQDGTGAWTYTFPSTAKGFSQPDPAASVCTQQLVFYDGTNYQGGNVSVPLSAWHGLTMPEGTAPGGLAGSDLLYADSTAHRIMMKNNNGAAQTIAALESPAFTTPNIGAAIGTSLALGGATLGSNALAVIGHTLLEGVTSTGATGTGKLVYDASPALSGIPTAPTAPVGTNTTQIATTEFVLANATGSYAKTLGNTAAVTMTGSDVTVFNMGTVPALAAGSCYEIGTIMNDPGGGGTPNKIYVDSTLVASIFGVTGAPAAVKSVILYCNGIGVQNAQTITVRETGYDTSGSDSGWSSSGPNGGPNITPTAIDWSTTHTITIKANRSSGTITGWAAWIR